MRIYGISTASAESLRDLQARLGLGVTLLSDPEGRAVSAFGMIDGGKLVSANLARAGSVLLDEGGRVIRVLLPESYVVRPRPEELLRGFS